MKKIELTCITQDDLLESGCFDMGLAMKTTARVIRDYADGHVLFPDKIVQIFDQQTQDRINCLPATLLKEGVCGTKWVSVFPSNYRRGLQNLTAVMVLSRTDTGFPIAFLEGTLCSNMRTAAVSAVAARYLARQDSGTIGFIGAGEQAKMHFMSMKTEFPGLKTCKVSSRTTTSSDTFTRQMSRLFPDVQFISCGSDFRQAICGSDIIITAISSQAAILKAAWVSRGAFYCHVGGLEDEDGVALSASKIVCDSWEAAKHRSQTISLLYQAGKLTDEDIHADLHELVNRTKDGRSSEGEFTYFNAVGLSYVDVALAFQFYKQVLAHKKGTPIELQSGSLWERDLHNQGEDGALS